jgi:hypothetical protein
MHGKAENPSRNSCRFGVYLLPLYLPAQLPKPGEPISIPTPHIKDPARRKPSDIHQCKPLTLTVNRRRTEYKVMGIP